MKKFWKRKSKNENIADEQVNEGFSDEEYQAHYELKSQGLENLLGKMDGLVGHAIIPFAVGGAVDMYYFPNHIKGTGFATMELIRPDGNGPKPNSFGTYELVAFTRLPYSMQVYSVQKGDTPFSKIERRICGIFTKIGFYSFEAVLKPGDTCEVPQNDEENTCIVFYNYTPDGKNFKIGEKEHHLLLCIELFKSEMDYARENGSQNLLELFKNAGYFPYSDMDRIPVA
jgi:hypothetical protein